MGEVEESGTVETVFGIEGCEVLGCHLTKSNDKSWLSKCDNLFKSRGASEHLMLGGRSDSDVPLVMEGWNATYDVGNSILDVGFDGFDEFIKEVSCWSYEGLTDDVFRFPWCFPDEEDLAGTGTSIEDGLASGVVEGTASTPLPLFYVGGEV